MTNSTGICLFPFYQVGYGRFQVRCCVQLVGMSPNGKYANAIRENQAVWHNAARFQQQM